MSVGLTYENNATLLSVKLQQKEFNCLYRLHITELGNSNYNI